jgi:hypothetical protein
MYILRVCSISGSVPKIRKKWHIREMNSLPLGNLGIVVEKNIK